MSGVQGRAWRACMLTLQDLHKKISNNPCLPGWRPFHLGGPVGAVPSPSASQPPFGSCGSQGAKHPKFHLWAALPIAPGELEEGVAHEEGISGGFGHPGAEPKKDWTANMDQPTKNKASEVISCRSLPCFRESVVLLKEAFRSPSQSSGVHTPIPYFVHHPRLEMAVERSRIMSPCTL